MVVGLKITLIDKSHHDNHNNNDKEVTLTCKPKDVCTINRTVQTQARSLRDVRLIR